MPLMVHVGEPPPLFDEVLDILGPGDIVTHCFNGKAGGQHRRGRGPVRLAERCAGEGIRLDVGHGGASFSFKVAEVAIRRGLLPFSISTDLHARSLDSPVWDMGTTMSKLLAVGMPFEAVIEAVTRAPMRVIGLPTRGSPGSGHARGIHRVRGERERSAHRRFDGGRGQSPRLIEPRLGDPRGGADQGQPLCSAQRMSHEGEAVRIAAGPAAR